MGLILKTDIENWGESTVVSIGSLPAVISNLVRATSPMGTSINFPAEKGVFSPGWDGVVNCAEKREFVPEGISLWELATTSGDLLTKANKDYNKRTADPGVHDCANSTYVFVATSHWPGRDAWVKEKNEQGIWKEVRAYDSNLLEQWFQLSAPISKWFANQIKKSGDFHNILLPLEFWDEWAQGPPGIKLIPQSVTVGRQIESEKLLKFFQGAPRIFAVRAASKDEAIAFIVASAILFDEDNKDKFFAKGLILDNIPQFRSFSELYKDPLILIAKTDGAPLHKAVANGHHVLLPLGPSDTYDSEDYINLPKIEKSGLIKSLIEIGLSPETASTRVTESGGDITILRRLLRFSQDKLEWTKPENARDIITALLVGRWSETLKGDLEIIETLSGEKYEDYILKLANWKEIVFFQIGVTWRLASPLDAWTNLAPFITAVELNKFAEAFIKVMSNNDPFYKMDQKERMMASFFNKAPLFSTWVKEGLTQSLILIGLHGSSLKLGNIASPQLWVDNVIHKLLENANGELWRSLNYQMPLIAEASPVSFMNAVDNSLSSTKPTVLEMFEEGEGFITPSSSHTGLLWALESLAWMPEFLGRATLILSKLARLDPGGSLSNRPKNSLYEIFKPWHYQTLANFDERIEVLKLIAAKEKEVAWNLLKRMLPDNGVGHNTHKMRWRMLNKDSVIITPEEFYKMQPVIIDIILSVSDYSEEKLAELVRISTNAGLSTVDKDRVFEFVKSNYEKGTHNKHLVLDELRKILSQHRSFQNEVDWALPEAILTKDDDFYFQIQPEDPIEQHSWMFEDSWPQFPEGFKRKQVNFDQQHELIQKKRTDGLEEIYESHGIIKIIELSRRVQFSWALGDTLGYLQLKDQDILDVLKCLYQNTTDLNFVYGFIHRKAILKTFEWVVIWYQNISKQNFNETAISRFFIPVSQSGDLWDYIYTISNDVYQLYWRYMNPGFYNLSDTEKIRGVKELVNVQRHVTALKTTNLIKENIPTDLIITVLQKTANEKSLEDVKVDDYEIASLFAELDIRKDVDEQSMVNLELAYLQILSSYGVHRKPTRLFKELMTNPKFFVDTLKLMYKPKNAELALKEKEGYTDDQINLFGERAYQLLNSWKGIPGVDKEGNIDATALKKWIEEVRTLSQEIDRIEVADSKIGEILAQYDSKGKGWPDEILAIIEDINTGSLKRNFSAGIFNLRGSSARGPFDGGDIERGHAEHFQKMAALYKNKYPNTAAIFESLSESYKADAKTMDDQAERDRLDH